MQGLSFREYLAMRHNLLLEPLCLPDVLSGACNNLDLPHPLAYFKDYLMCGYYPFGTDPDFFTELIQVINRTIDVDIPQYVGMNAAANLKLKKLLVYVSENAPFKLNSSKIASIVGVSRNNVENYLQYMHRAGMISQVGAKPVALRSLAKPEKIYLDNTNLMYALGGSSVDIGTVRETFFQNQLRVCGQVCTSQQGDFTLGNYTFEVGGKSKDSSQIATVENAYVVKDDIEFSSGNVIPLWAFGLLY
jgi:hypothetical protein